MTEGRNTPGGYWARLRQHKQEIMNVRAEEARRESRAQRAVARAGEVLSHPLFFLAMLALHGLWLVLNIPALSPVPPWDPPPFMLLATIASVEAPLLALLILMRQQRDARIGELREETGLQVELHTERQTSKMLRMLEEMHRHMAIPSDELDEELDEMKRPLEPDRLLRLMESELDASDPMSGTEEERSE